MGVANLHVPAALSPWKEPLGGTQNQSGRDGEEKISAVAENRTPITQPVACSLY
jgi:hypothetical protein